MAEIIIALHGSAARQEVVRRQALAAQQGTTDDMVKWYLIGRAVEYVEGRMGGEVFEDNVEV